MRVLVCGGRNFSDYSYVAYVLYTGLNLGKDDVIIHGGAKGADSLADRYAKEQGIPVEVYNADWDTHGKKAGILRNIQMLNEGKPDIVIGFPGGKGTQHMIGIAQKADIPTRYLE